MIKSSSVCDGECIRKKRVLDKILKAKFNCQLGVDKNQRKAKCRDLTGKSIVCCEEAKGRIMEEGTVTVTCNFSS